MKTKYLIRRGKPLNLDIILMEGEMAICQIKNKFYVGDGVHKLSELTPFTSLVTGDDGRIYTVRVDKNGNAQAKPVKQFYNGQEFEFRISE